MAEDDGDGDIHGCARWRLKGREGDNQICVDPAVDLKQNLAENRPETMDVGSWGFGCNNGDQVRGRR